MKDISGNYQFGQPDREWLEYKDEFGTVSLETYVCEVYLDPFLINPDNERLELLLARLIKNRFKNSNDTLILSLRNISDGEARIEIALKNLTLFMNHLGITLKDEKVFSKMIEYDYEFTKAPPGLGSWLLLKTT